MFESSKASANRTFMLESKQHKKTPSTMSRQDNNRIPALDNSGVVGSKIKPGDLQAEMHQSLGNTKYAPQKKKSSFTNRKGGKHTEETQTVLKSMWVKETQLVASDIGGDGDSAMTKTINSDAHIGGFQINSGKRE